MQQSRAYLQVLENITKQVMVVAELVHLNHLKYPFALILTKCDLLEPGSSSLQMLNKRLQPLTSSLDKVGVNYQTFHTFIPIVNSEGASTLKSRGATAPFLWLVWELSKAYKPNLTRNLLELVPRLQPVDDFQKQQKLIDGSLQSLFSSVGKGVQVKKILGLYLFADTRKSLSMLLLASTALLGLTVLFLTDYKWPLQSEPKNFAALRNLDSLMQSKQLDKVVPLLEKLIQQEPDQMEWRLRLAQLYEVTGQVSKAEIVYDQVLTQQKNHFQALVGKAVLRNAYGDTKTARDLFAQAERAAPVELKTYIHTVAQKTLTPP